MDAAEHLVLAQAAERAGRLDEAERHFKAALDADIDNFAAANELGLLFKQRRDFAKATIYLTHALALDGASAATAYALAEVHREEARPGDALLHYERALAVQPDFTEAKAERERILRLLAQSDAAALSALSWFNLGFALQETKRFAAASLAFDKALLLDPSLPYLRGARLDARLQICDWRNLNVERSELLARVKAGEPAAWPFQILALTDDPALQLGCARTFVADKFPPQPPLAARPYDHPRLRIGYLSSDFRNHPVGLLMAGIIEQHDREKFECFGISLGAGDASPARRRLEKAFDRFLDASQMRDEDVAAGLRELEIDILVDLNGHTAGARTGILARRPAPLQVNFLGYAASMGAEYIDYIIADRVLIPSADEAFYSEKIAALPCFQPNTIRPVTERTPSRAECGLPERGFVFCAFNTAFKIGPEIFDVWMRLLKEISGSVLWLRDAGPDMRANLQREASARGVEPGRLVFAPPLPAIEDHLARHRQADLFLDTINYNAHTTASDALWSGLPVITCPGHSYASRVSASLLSALGLKDLVAKSLADYEALALKLAKNPSLLAQVANRLARAKETSPLFDSPGFTRRLERAYRIMWDRQRKGLPPQSFDVSP